VWPGTSGSPSPTAGVVLVGSNCGLRQPTSTPTPPMQQCRITEDQRRRRTMREVSMREVRPEARYGRSFATDTSVLNDPARQNPARAAENRSKIERRRATHSGMRAIPSHKRSRPCGNALASGIDGIRFRGAVAIFGRCMTNRQLREGEASGWKPATLLHTALRRFATPTMFTTRMKL
jgi:hypothetical protein